MTNINTQSKVKDTITLTKQEYLRLQQQAKAYRIVVSKMFELPLKNPIDEVVLDFKKTKLYTEEFLEDLEDGLRKSSYSKRYANKTT